MSERPDTAPDPRGSAGRVIYSMGVSLDGFVAGPRGEIDWSAPDEELHLFHNEQMRELAVQLCGRRLYEAMRYWDTVDEASLPAHEREFAELWRELPKLVFSRTLRRVEGNATLARAGLAQELARLTAGAGAVAIGGAALAASAVELGLVDEYRLFLSPIALGAGTPYLPPMERALELELLDARTFGGRVVYLRYGRA